jgi:hypothetical protein
LKYVITFSDYCLVSSNLIKFQECDRRDLIPNPGIYPFGL